MRDGAETERIDIDGGMTGEAGKELVDARRWLVESQEIDKDAGRR